MSVNSPPDGKGPNYGQSRLIGVGENVFAIPLPQGDSKNNSSISKQALLLNDGGYCFNSRKHNTRSHPKVCDSSPIPTPTVMDYNFGSNWFEGNPTNSMVTACNPQLLKGSFGIGRAPSAALNPKTSTVLVAHEAHGKKAAGCGKSAFKKGVVLTSLKMPIFDP